ncbi:xanthine dehydrogenase family protein molybdopterin-binding subunit [Subsaximicrobium wynnwilliamsii]|uniref:Xanthine dehydrogenase family protein molybdopterin-binding subunit n=1 Tax=Subsaximicrobium wynnwilliamsii TaxID=291179 RepID=A0A5C6ZF80_9FLAO|nr:xanthine dehydrogenase family protein molybdopterin-binding subunit [Subsaximicrobium wynnwilliamsii]TXD83155.1 xanthine dehydrogenase family protein molybdopterin-binding subunit [Subsaximicrobium wynnwilliamsii]TXD88268.1 xanthine dehydrogenase family protein molybdopterin-binding subunit [Subsaximicrobium wynnwilliamsii]TXE02989.1 xanthine dehydrogenase family protein molybdopterin-binding subunit [Subsaximicrobium wynnwilliamsii]
MKISKQIGKSVNRLEGHLKVTGAAKYAGEYDVPGLLQGYIVNSTITKGKILEIDESAAHALSGVVAIFSHNNRTKLPWFDIMYADMDAPPGTPFKPFYNDQILYNGQPIALVVAETFETARYAATLIKVTYDEEPFETELAAHLDDARDPKKGIATFIKPLPPSANGDFEKAYNDADVQYAGEFIHGTEHHNPLELFTTTTVYEGDGKLTVYDKTQGTSNCQIYIANVFGLHYKDVRILSPFVGGAFGSGLRPQYQLFLCVMASLELKRNVRVTMDRAQMFTFGHRPQTIQKTRFGATADGTVTAINHTAIAETSQHEDYTEVVVNWANMLYPAKNTLLDYKLVPLDVFSPMDMRAPGGSTGLHAIEATMDALSYILKVDPMELRLLNYAERDVSANKPFSSKELKQCYLQGAEKFGWANRKSEPRTTRRGNRLVGTGMSSGIWDVIALPAKAKASINKKGKLKVKSAVTDIGTGTLTVMTQIAADSLGIHIDDVTFEYGDSNMPLSPIQGGSYTTGVVGSAVKAACESLKKKIFKKAKKMNNSTFNSVALEDVVFEDGSMHLKQDKSNFVTFKEIIADNDGKKIKASKNNIPNVLKLKQYTRAAHSAAFVEVEVDEQLGIVNVTRAVTAVAAGKIINPKTARSQILGGMIWGISKALREETLMDHNLGKYMNTDLGEYHIPVHADIHELDVIFVDEKDDIINELGSKGVGEIGLASMAPAIANAIYHATGKRVNKFPIHFDQLL